MIFWLVLDICWVKKIIDAIILSYPILSYPQVPDFMLIFLYLTPTQSVWNLYARTIIENHVKLGHFHVQYIPMIVWYFTILACAIISIVSAAQIAISIVTSGVLSTVVKKEESSGACSKEIMLKLNKIFPH